MRFSSLDLGHSKLEIHPSTDLFSSLRYSAVLFTLFFTFSFLHFDIRYSAVLFSSSFSSLRYSIFDIRYSAVLFFFILFFTSIFEIRYSLFVILQFSLSSPQIKHSTLDIGNSSSLT